MVNSSMIFVTVTVVHLSKRYVAHASSAKTWRKHWDKTELPVFLATWPAVLRVSW